MYPDLDFTYEYAGHPRQPASSRFSTEQGAQKRAAGCFYLGSLFEVSGLWPMGIS